jgi:hypothetical protein
MYTAVLPSVGIEGALLELERRGLGGKPAEGRASSM